MLVKILIAYLLVFNFTIMAQQSESEAALTHLISYWYRSFWGQFDGVGWWISGTCLQSITDFSLKTQNTSFSNVIDNLYVKNGVSIYTEGYDDIQWWALAWTSAYKLTNTKSYLSRAETIFQEVQKVWTQDCGGGVWWDRKQSYKNSITNELFLSLSSELYLLTNNSSYKTWAIEEWNWFNKSGLINGQNLINDGLDSQSCKNNGQTTWTYNQGVILGGLVNLYKITNDEKYLNTASQIASAAISHLSTNGILQETCEPSKNCNQDQSRFKGIFIRNLAQLYEATQNAQFLSFITKNAQSVWNSDRNGSAFGIYWNGPFDSSDASRQCSAIDVFNAAI